MLADIIVHCIVILRDAFLAITFWELLQKNVTNCDNDGCFGIGFVNVKTNDYIFNSLYNVRPFTVYRYFGEDVEACQDKAVGQSRQ